MKKQNCRAADCKEDFRAKGYCLQHYQELIFAKKRPLYKTWCNIVQRCHNPNNPGYRHYGGRGIKMCERWRCDYKTFETDIGERPPNRTLDRVNNDGDYEPENVRWATPKQQAANRRLYGSAK